MLAEDEGRAGGVGEPAVTGGHGGESSAWPARRRAPRRGDGSRARAGAARECGTLPAWRGVGGANVAASPGQRSRPRRVGVWEAAGRRRRGPPEGRCVAPPCIPCAASSWPLGLRRGGDGPGGHGGGCTHLDGRACRGRTLHGRVLLARASPPLAAGAVSAKGSGIEKRLRAPGQPTVLRAAAPPPRGRCTACEP